jgi:hypothetical protein
MLLASLVPLSVSLPAPARFGVRVQDRGARQARCQGTSGRDGTFIEPFDAKGPRDPESGDWSTGERAGEPTGDPAGESGADVGPEKEEP